MARNKYPEETVERILVVANRLFTEKGYENTSIQDIIDHLGGLSKGAIYHHFKSKEDIMLAVLERHYEELDASWMDAIRDDTGKTGAQKLHDMFLASVASARQDDMFSSGPNMLKNPKMLVAQMESIMEEAAPRFIAPVIEQGVADGTIRTDYPQQLAEVMLLLVNLWVTPMVFNAPYEELEKRVALFRQLMRPFGADFVSDDIMVSVEKLYKLYAQKAEPRSIK